MKIRYLLYTIAAVLVLSGCQGVGLKTNKAVPETTAETVEPTLPPWTEEEDLDLYNAYVDLYNFLNNGFDQAINRYFRNVEFQEEFVHVKEDYDTCSFSKYDFNKIEKVHELLSEKPDRSGIDQAFLQNSDTIAGILTTMNDIYEYTDMKSYLDDDYAKGAAQHAELWGQLVTYEENIGEFMVLFLDEVAVAQEGYLEKLKEEGYEVLYAANLVIGSAQAIQDELYYEGVDDDNLLLMNLEVLEPMYEEYISHVDLLLECAGDPEKLSREGYGTMNSHWMFFVNSVKETRSSMTQLMAKVRNNEELTTHDRMIVMEGQCSLASFDSGVSTMISHYNSMIN